ncbi:MAG: 1-aminocyclopropane-1-carboxylate deaminase [Cyclobacteriaceae bacterium]|jgi:1-aminocyclopropane-1-carboxylate deaminase
MNLNISETPTQLLDSPFLAAKGVRVLVKRDDLTHKTVMGNKWRKLKYNLQFAIDSSATGIATYGGAFSNHIAATAAACNLAGLQSVGIIRGDELNSNSNPTLSLAAKDGMRLIFVDRIKYRELTSTLQMPPQVPKSFYVLPEGGTNELAIKGCSEILEEVKETFDIVCAPVGTGGTCLGLLKTITTNQELYGFSALRGSWINKEFALLMEQYKITSPRFKLFEDVKFGGYAKHNPTLIQFILGFRQEYDILLDPIYTGKMFYSVWDMVKNDQIARGTSLLLIHTGGLQGVSGFNFRFGQSLPSS